MTLATSTLDPSFFIKYVFIEILLSFIEITLLCDSGAYIRGLKVIIRIAV